MLHGLLKQILPDVCTIISMDTIVQLFREGRTASALTPNVKELLRVYLLAPMSVAAGERTFSVQRRVKSYVRSTMTNKRNNDLMILHIHKERTDKINLIEIVKQFVFSNDRRIHVFGKY